MQKHANTTSDLAEARCRQRHDRHCHHVLSLGAAAHQLSATHEERVDLIDGQADAIGRGECGDCGHGARERRLGIDAASDHHRQDSVEDARERVDLHERLPRLDGNDRDAQYSDSPRPNEDASASVESSIADGNEHRRRTVEELGSDRSWVQRGDEADPRAAPQRRQSARRDFIGGDHRDEIRSGSFLNFLDDDRQSTHPSNVLQREPLRKEASSAPETIGVTEPTRSRAYSLERLGRGESASSIASRMHDSPSERADTRLPDDVRRFVESALWKFAKTYAATWPHEYIVRTPENAASLLALALHVFEHGTDGRFYAQVRKYHHEDGKVYWSMDLTPEATTLINRCDETQTYEARLAAGSLPSNSLKLANTRSRQVIP
jgi:hypothetical protein